MLKILIVDDQMINRMLLDALVKSIGHEPIQAESGQQAIDAVSAHSIDMILMDIEMPEMNGVEATKYIRENELVAADLPIVAVTANSEEEDKASYRAAGMQGYIEKPLNVDRLKEVIAEFNL